MRKDVRPAPDEIVEYLRRSLEWIETLPEGDERRDEYLAILQPSRVWALIARIDAREGARIQALKAELETLNKRYARDTNRLERTIETLKEQLVGYQTPDFDEAFLSTLMGKSNNAHRLAYVAWRRFFMPYPLTQKQMADEMGVSLHVARNLEGHALALMMRSSRLPLLLDRLPEDHRLREQFEYELERRQERDRRRREATTDPVEPASIVMDQPSTVTEPS